jgi:hypothetical protein
VVERLPSKCKALSSKVTKKKKVWEEAGHDWEPGAVSGISWFSLCLRSKCPIVIRPNVRTSCQGEKDLSGQAWEDFPFISWARTS